MTSRREAIRAAALVLVEACAERDALSPREAAEAAWYPGHRLVTVDAIEALIIRQREEAIAMSGKQLQSAA
ncbi:hypothetical protein OG689_10465 [Kitasatospora sp. NBC_00240]|uniref:hypothetical protein n=1 Tax=Kitasatospora sp. NBC_00240 TaxID=2903567 RepID=UPI00225481C8|nr:hypothetical protein [Kitasatospora sp. NBC_00240]MCX5209705.1 hypothetical protein [Kitasatospora sp. NBC_00240]